MSQFFCGWFVLVFLLALDEFGGLAQAPFPTKPTTAVIEAEADRIATVQKMASTTVTVSGLLGTGGGSGVLISSDGYALTNCHVIRPSGAALKCGLPDGRLYDAVLVGVDPTGDVALIKLFGRNDFPQCEMGDSDLLRVGNPVFVIGNPFQLASDYQPTVTSGIVSGTHRYQYPSGTLLEYTDCIQTDAAINPGNSGGPLFNDRGQLVGIVGRASFDKRGRVNVGVGYAISINQVKNFLSYLKSGRIVDHATLGATVSTDDEGRVVVDEILESSDAYRRGLRYDDQIVRFGGREINTVNMFKNTLGIYPRGWRVPLTYRRSGQTYHCLVRLLGMHAEGELATLMDQGSLPQPGDRPEKGGPHLPLPSQEQATLAREVPVPEVVTNHYEARRGYGNYYFNRVHQQRIRKNLLARSNVSGLGHDWLIEGERPDGSQVHIELLPSVGLMRLPDEEWKVAFDDPLASMLHAPHGRGLLVAFHVWRQFLTSTPENFGEIYYFGQVPLAGSREMADVLVGTSGGLETRFFFSPKSGDLVAMEVFLDDDSDPCEIKFDDFRPYAGALLPYQFRVRFGGITYLVLRVKRFDLGDKTTSY